MAPKRQTRLTTALPPSEHFFKPKTNDGTKYLFTLYRIGGILAPNRFKTLYAIYSFVINALAIILLPLMFLISYVERSGELEIQELLSSLQSFFGTCTSGAKFAALICLRKYLFNIEAILDKLDARIQNSEEIREVETIIRNGNRTLMVFIIMYYAFLVSICIGAVYTGQPPYSFYIPYLNWRECTFNLVISSAIELLLVNTAIIDNLINDTYGIIYIGILQSHFKMLIMRVLRIGTDPSSTQEDNLKELVRCLQDHKNIIELIKTLGAVLSKTYFIQFLSTTSCLCATLLNLTISSEKAALLGSAILALCLVIQILPICYIANSLAAESDRLPAAIFHMNWMDQSPEFKRMCLFFMHRSQETVVFDAGKFFAISLNSFISIIKFTFSVYTLLSNMNLAEIFNY